MRVAILLLLLAAFLYGSVCLAVWANQKRLVYFPSPNVGSPPRDCAAVWVTASDGVRSEAWVLHTRGDHPWVLYLHGNGGNLAGHIDDVEFFRRLGCNCMALDYRGYGHSEGTPDEAGLGRDAEACWEYLTGPLRVSPDRIILVGESLGGGVACGLAAQHEPGGLVLISTFTSMVDMGVRTYPWLPVAWLANQYYPSATRLAHVRCPKLVIHSPEDDVIPYALGRALFEQAAGPKTFYQTQGPHNISPLRREPGYAQAVSTFIQACATAKF